MIKLTKQFRKYLQNKPDCKRSRLSQANTFERGPVYVKRWIRRKHFALFRLSNKITHVCFNDTSELVVDKGSRQQLTYVDLFGEQRQLSVSELAKDSEVSSKL